MDLYRLQCLDSEGETNQRRLAEVEAALGESEALRQTRRALEHAQALVKKWALRQRDLELEFQGLAGKLARSEQRLYSGVVKNPKELTDLQAEIAVLRRRQQKLENDLLEAMIEREEAEARHAQTQEHLDDTQAHWVAQQADLEAKREMLREKIAEIARARAELLPNVEAGGLAVYQALRRSKGRLAVAQMRDGVCGVCGVTISPRLEWKLRQEELVHCDNCERIIVRIR